jgi:flagellar motor protein MotB
MAQRLQTWCWLGCFCGLALVALGCNRNPYANNPYAIGPNGLMAQPQGLGGNMQMPIVQPGALGMPPLNSLGMNPQLAEYQRRIQQLDDTNRSLTTQLAQAQQQSQLSRDRADLLAKQLQDTNSQLQQSLLAQRQIETQARGMQASMSARGGAKLTANNSVATSASTLQISGARVIQDGDLLRIRISADQLFAPGTAQINSSGSVMLDQVAQALATQFARQRVGIEGHTDTGQLYGGAFATPYQLAGAQAQALMDQFVRRNNVPMQQLFVVAHGPNHPIGDNQSAAGRADNRRIEIVIYPETY